MDADEVALFLTSECRPGRPVGFVADNKIELGHSVVGLRSRDHLN